jgi:hypothetical protein
VDEARKQGLSPRPNWIEYECGFQMKSNLNGLSLPVITIKIDRNIKTARAIIGHLRTMTKDRMTYTYAEAVKQIIPEICKNISPASELILLDRNKNMLRFTLKVNNVMSMTSIYIHNDSLFHIICTAFKEDQKDFDIFTYISDSFIVK